MSGPVSANKCSMDETHKPNVCVCGLWLRLRIIITAEVEAALGSCQSGDVILASRQCLKSQVQVHGLKRQTKDTVSSFLVIYPPVHPEEFSKSAQ